MEELIKLAKKFMDENGGINEIELTDAWNNTVRLARNSPVAGYYPQPTWTPWHYTSSPTGYNPNQPEGL